MRYAKPFFDLQLRFAEAVAARSGRPLADVVLGFTNFYVRFGLGRDFDPAHPDWRCYVAGLREAGDVREWTYRYYCARGADRGAPAVAATFGCFAYARLPDGRLRLHFDNVETGGRSPLGPARREHRVTELRALVEHVARTEPPDACLRGGSWLYNLEAYRQLFPPSYLASATPLRGLFRHMPLWGQFLARDGTVRETPARAFVGRLERQSSADDVEECFPLRPLAVEAPVAEFRRFYGV
jgi:hypothetical protein